MLAIRLSRFGKKNYPFFRVVVMDKKKSAKGRALEVLGSVNPQNYDIVLKTERIQYWLGVGAEASDRVHNILVSKNIIKGPKRVKKIRAKKTEEKESEAESKKQEASEEKPVNAITEEAKPEEPKEEAKRTEEPETKEPKESKPEEKPTKEKIKPKKAKKEEKPAKTEKEQKEIKEV
jgi:small subunit ribosomal protein S16